MIDLGELPDEEDDQLEELRGSPVYQYLEANAGWEKFTNFPSHTVIDLWRLVDAFMGQGRRRGPISLTSTMDHVVLYLIWLNTGSSYDKIAIVFKISETHLEDVLNRVRGRCCRS